jgi:hypothetical protein
VAVEALRLVHARKKSSVRELLEYARLCRVERVMMPYLESPYNVLACILGTVFGGFLGYSAGSQSEYGTKN